uniref:Uncharacterized protein n=1 Tax=Branchiostoma floridae TaxID=7739 RepID=C3ZSA9_BRAFL|eukprot:XP_002588528.1 hypothetical protein BRAFLDRAFT_79484 [Branchiostoma floridae]
MSPDSPGDKTSSKPCYRATTPPGLAPTFHRAAKLAQRPLPPHRLIVDNAVQPLPRCYATDKPPPCAETIPPCGCPLRLHPCNPVPRTSTDPVHRAVASRLQPDLSGLLFADELSQP